LRNFFLKVLDLCFLLLWVGVFVILVFVFFIIIRLESAAEKAPEGLDEQLL